MSILVTICARGGSKRVKGKNIMMVSGKPLISYAIDLAKQWGRAKRIVCSTDSEKIAEIAKNLGADVPFVRSARLSTGTAGKLEVIRDALVNSEKVYKEKYDIIVDLDVTNPLKTKNDLDNCLSIFKKKNAEVLLSVTRARRNPYFNMVELNNKGFAELSKKPKSTILRTQSTPKVYDVNASVYFYSRDFLLNPKNSFVLESKKAAIYVMDDVCGTDIDSEDDLKYIEFLLKNKAVEGVV